MAEKQEERAAALSGLRNRLTDGLARSRLTKRDLASGVNLGRTTVQEAFQNDGPVPSAATVAALARTLRLPVGELLALRRIAAGEARDADGENPGPGRPIGVWHPHDLEVHPAGPALSMELSSYVPRAHDRVLAEAVRDAAEGKSRMLVLIGSSSTGKTRACWEAVQPLAADGWHLWHPFDPTRAHAALADLRHVRQRTVVWLNEAQHYLGDPRTGERIAAAVHGLLTEPARGPVLVLGTLWPEYAKQYTTLPRPNESDPHSRVRELLAGRTVTVAEAFDRDALATASTLAETDDLLARALERSGGDGRVAQDLAGAPELLRRYENGTPPVRALLAAAMDARRLGVGLHLPQEFLIDAAVDYLDDHDYDQLTEDWAEDAFADLARPVHGKQAPLRRTATRPRRQPPTSRAPDDVFVVGAAPVLRLADFLEQHGRSERERLCPPASFWASASAHLNQAGDLSNLARAARSRQRLRWAHHLFRGAADVGDTNALVELAEMRKRAGDAEGADAFLAQAAAAEHPDALMELAKRREGERDIEGATALYRRAAGAGSTVALQRLAEARAEAGDVDAAEDLYQAAVGAGHSPALLDLARLRAEAGDVEGAEVLYEQAADAIDPVLLVRLLDVRVTLAQAKGQTSDLDGSDVLYRRAADSGDPAGLVFLAKRRMAVSDDAEAEALQQRIIDTGDADALMELGQLRLGGGDVEGAEALFQLAADAGSTTSMVLLATVRSAFGDNPEAEAQYQRAADAGELVAVSMLARYRVETGDVEGAEGLYKRAIDAGDRHAVLDLARMREDLGDTEGAETLHREIADSGFAESALADRWPFGLDADGTPSSPWN